MSDSYHHGNLRKELIAAGLKMLSRDGIAAFSLRSLSKELGVSHTAAYRHFKSREDLLKAIIIESSQMFHKALEESVKPGTSGEEALMQLGCGYVRFFLDNPEILPLFNMIPSEQSLLASVLNGMDKKDPVCIALEGNSDSSDLDMLSRDSAFGIFRSIAKAAKENEIYRDFSEREILLGFWSKVHGMASILITQKNFIPDDEIDAVIERIIRTPF